jgi:hypothetical protein
MNIGFFIGLGVAWCWGQWCAANLPTGPGVLITLIGCGFIGFSAAAFDRSRDEKNK